MVSRARKKKIKVPDISEQEYDIGTPELHLRQPIEVYGADKKKRARSLKDPMDYYYNKELIDRDQHSAGHQFYKLWWHGGGRMSYATMNLMRLPGGNDGEYSSAMREKYKIAVEAFSSPLASHMVHQVVCVGENTQVAMKKAVRAAMDDASDPRNKGMKYLRIGLDDLVKQFSNKKAQRGIHE